MTTEVKHDWAECVRLDLLENDAYTKRVESRNPTACISTIRRGLSTLLSVAIMSRGAKKPRLRLSLSGCANRGRQRGGTERSSQHRFCHAHLPTSEDRFGGARPVVVRANCSGRSAPLPTRRR